MIVFSVIVANTSSADAATQGSAYELVKYEKVVNVDVSHTFDVHAKITVNFPRKMSEIEFALPSGKYIVDSVTTDDKDVTAEMISSASGNKVKLTTAKNFKKGQHVFTVNYRIRKYSELVEEYDLLYYNVLLPNWKTPMGELNITVNFPKDFPMDKIEPYAGKFGVQDKTGKIKFVINDRSNTVLILGERIPENYAITLKAELPNGYWKGAINHSWAAYLCAGMMLLVLLIGIIMWLIGGRDPKVGKLEQKKPLDEINPVEIGYILDGRFRIRDISALIIYFANKGYLKISQYAPKKFKLIRLEEPKEEQRYIRNLYSILFENVFENRAIEVEKLGRRLTRMYRNAELDVSSGFSDKEMAAKTPLSRTLSTVIAVMFLISIGMIPVFRSLYSYVDIPIIEAIVVAALELALITTAVNLFENSYEMSKRRFMVLFSATMIAILGIIVYELWQFVAVSKEYIFAAVVLLAACLVLLLIFYMPARGAKNAELAAKLLSLRKYIYRAKPNDVDAMYFEDNDYYYDMMPFACAFSAIESWAKTFKWLRVEQPSWYSDDIEGHAETNNSSFTTYDNAKDIKSFVRTLEDYYNKTARYYQTEKKRTIFKSE